MPRISRGEPAEPNFNRARRQFLFRKSTFSFHVALPLTLKQVLLIMESPYELKFLVEKNDAEVAVLEQDMAPLDLHLSSFMQDLKCVLVARFENVFIIE